MNAVYCAIYTYNLKSTTCYEIFSHIREDEQHGIFFLKKVKFQVHN